MPVLMGEGEGGGIYTGLVFAFLLYLRKFQPHRRRMIEFVVYCVYKHASLAFSLRRAAWHCMALAWS